MRTEPDLREEIRQRLLERLDMSRDLDDGEIRSLIRSEVMDEGHRYGLSVSERLTLEKQVFDSLRKLDVLQALLDDDEVTEVLVNGPEDIFYEKGGRIYRSKETFSSDEKLFDVIQQIVSVNNKIVNESSPIVDTRLPDGSRVNIILPPIAIDHGVISIRRFPKEQITMERLLELGSISEDMVSFLRMLVVAGYNIFCSGGTGSGKTTFLNALTQFIPPGERVITIEDAAELQIIGVEDLVRLEARSGNLEGKLEVPIRELVRASLRMRPDRIIVGECRGAEALEVLQACNTGHDGSLSTGHANSCEDMISRLESMVLMGAELPLAAIRQQIAAGIDLFVHLGRMRDHSRKVLEISEVLGMEDGKVVVSTLYRYEPDESGGGYWSCPGKLHHTRKLEMAGILPGGSMAY